MPAAFQPYSNLLARARELSFVDAASALLQWDEETYMPRAALAFRAEQAAFLSGWSHRQFIAPEVGDWIKACEDRGFAPESDEAANVRNRRWAYDRATKLPPELVEEFNRATTLARDAWVAARKNPHTRPALAASGTDAPRDGQSHYRPASTGVPAGKVPGTIDVGRVAPPAPSRGL